MYPNVGVSFISPFPTSTRVSIKYDMLSSKGCFSYIQISNDIKYKIQISLMCISFFCVKFDIKSLVKVERVLLRMVF